MCKIAGILNKSRSENLNSRCVERGNEIKSDTGRTTDSEIKFIYNYIEMYGHSLPAPQKKGNKNAEKQKKLNFTFISSYKKIQKCKIRQDGCALIQALPCKWEQLRITTGRGTK